MPQMHGTHAYRPSYETKPYPEPINRFVGGHFEWHSTTTIHLIDDAEDGKIRVIVGNGSQEQMITFAESKNVVITTAGPYGLHNSYNEAASTCYVIYAAWNSYSNPDEDLDYVATDDHPFEGCIFALPSGVAPTAGIIAALTGDFDSWSKPLGFVSNNAGSNFLPFWNVDRKTFKYVGHYGVEAPTGSGAEVADTKIDLSGIVPDEAAKFRVVCDAVNTDVNARTYNLVLDDAVTPYIAYTSINLRDGAAGFPMRDTTVFDLDMIQPDATDVLSYIWSGAPTGDGLTLYVQAVTLFE